MNFSRQREIIYEQVRNFPVHPTAEEVYRALKNDNPNLSLGTVYGRTDRHYHMICEKCGRVFDVELDCLDAIPQTVLQSTGHHITRVTLNLKGVCAECSASEQGSEQ